MKYDMLSIEQISSQYWLVRYDANGNPFVVDGPFLTREQAETMTKVNDL